MEEITTALCTYADEVWTFDVAVGAGGNTRLLTALPTLGSVNRTRLGAQTLNNTLKLPMAWDEFGLAHLTVQGSVFVSGGSQREPQMFRTHRVKCTLTVAPRPRLSHVQPSIGSVVGGTRMTVHGYHLASPSRTALLSITLNGQACADVVVLSSQAASCVAPPAHPMWQYQKCPQAPSPLLGGANVSSSERGMVDVAVSVLETADASSNTARYFRQELRQATLKHGFRYVLLLVASASQQSKQGMLSALSPDVESPPLDARTTLWTTPLATSAAIHALAVWQERVVVAGNFRGPPFLDHSRVESLRDKAHNIVSWLASGQEGVGIGLQPLGLGLDGPVLTLAALSDRLVVGGSFSRAFQTHGSPLLDCGGILSWDGTRWSLFGGAPVSGTVSSTLAVDGLLYVAGSFQAVGTMQASGLAVFDASMDSWSDHLGAVRGGLVRAMVWWRNSLVLAGSFTHVGHNLEEAGVSVSGLARWQDGVWEGIGAMKGDLLALATSDDALYVGGEFASLEGSFSPLIGVYRDGKLEPLVATGSPPLAGRSVSCAAAPTKSLSALPALRVACLNDKYAA